MNAFVNESDLASVTKADFAYEYEIKISRTDFFRDQVKYRHAFYLAGVNKFKQMPRHFIYVTPPGLVTVGEVPSYAGLWEIHGRFLLEVKKPPRLADNKITDIQRKNLIRRLENLVWYKLYDAASWPPNLVL